MTPDELSLAEAVGRLTEENKRLRDELTQSQRTVEWTKREFHLRKIIKPLAWGSAVWAGAFLLSRLVGYCATPDEPLRVTRCTIEERMIPHWETLPGATSQTWMYHHFGDFVLTGITNRKQDLNYGLFPTLQAAIDASKLLKCPDPSP